MPVVRADHQVAQKLHAASEPGSERVRDLVDLQLLDRGEDLDLALVRTACERLFEYRRLHSWPPMIAASDGWDTLYEAAIEGVDVLPDIEAAVARANELIRRIADA